MNLRRISNKIAREFTSGVGTLYHFTSAENIKKIVKGGFKMVGGSFGALSFTKDRNGGNLRLLNSADVRITVDGDKLARKYNLEDFDFFNKTKSEQELRIPYVIWEKNEEGKMHKRKIFDKIDISKYIKAIDVEDYNNIEDEKLINWLKRNTKYNIDLID